MGLHGLDLEGLQQVLMSQLQTGVLGLELLDFLEKTHVLLLQLPHVHSVDLVELGTPESFFTLLLAVLAVLTVLAVPALPTHQLHFLFHPPILVLQEDVQFLREVVYPLLLEETLEGSVFQRFLHERQRVELQKLVGFGQIGALRVQVLLEGSDFVFRNAAFAFEGGVDVEDEEVNSQIELQFFLPAQEEEEFEEVGAFALVEVGDQLFAVVSIGGLVEFGGCLQAVVQYQKGEHLNYRL